MPGAAPSVILSALGLNLHVTSLVQTEREFCARSLDENPLSATKAPRHKEEEEKEQISYHTLGSL